MIVIYQYDAIWYKIWYICTVNNVKECSYCFKISLVMNPNFIYVYGMHLNGRDWNKCPQEFLKGKYLLILW